MGTAGEFIGIVAVRFAVGVFAGIASGSGRGAFDQTLMDQELALVADRDDNAGTLAVGLAVDRFGLGRLNDLVTALFETRGWERPLPGRPICRFRCR